jgi:hypothetical protein
MKYNIDNVRKSVSTLVETKTLRELEEYTFDPFSLDDIYANHFGDIEDILYFNMTDLIKNPDGINNL